MKKNSWMLLALNVVLFATVSACSSNVKLEFDAQQSLDGDTTVIESGSFSSTVELTKIKTLSALLNFFVDMESVDIVKIREVRNDLEAKQDTHEDIELTDTVINGVPSVKYSLGNSESGKIILSLHGGAYTSGSPLSPYWLNTNMMLALNHDLISPDYRLAPENPYPAAVDDAEKVYRSLLEKYKSNDITVIGESAGGGLALALLIRAKAKNLPMPGGVIVFSPWTDVGLSSDSLQRNRDRDFLNPKEVARWAKAYVGEGDVLNPEISPVYGNFSAAPPVLIFVGSEEIIHDDSLRIHEVLKRDGVLSKLQIWNGMWHIWPNDKSDEFPEIEKTMQVSAAFYSRFIKPNQN